MALSAQRESSGIDLLTCLGNAIKEVVETFLPDALFGGQVSIVKPMMYNWKATERDAVPVLEHRPSVHDIFSVACGFAALRLPD